jgi:hypothetical protein
MPRLLAQAEQHVYLCPAQISDHKLLAQAQPHALAALLA